MATKNQNQRLDVLEQQVSELMASQTTMLQGQVQVEARMESKLKSIGEMLRSQILSSIKDQEAGITGRCKDSSLESPKSHAATRSTSRSGGVHRTRNNYGVLSPVPTIRLQSEHQAQVATKTLKLNFPRFNGKNPRHWLRKCTRYVAYNSMSDYDKISLVAMNLDGAADHWFVDYIDGKQNLTWNEFTKLIMERFMNLTGGSLVAQFHKLRQITSIQAYITEFEEIKALMKEHNHSLTEGIS